MSKEDEEKKTEGSGEKGKEGKEGETEVNVVDIVKLREELWNLCGEGKVHDLKKFLEENSEHITEEMLNEENEEFDEDGAHVLMHCVKEGCDHAPTGHRDYPGCVRLLAERGSRINHADKAQRTSLHWAVFYHNIHLVKELANLGADISLNDQDGVNPFHVSIKLGLHDIFMVLAEKCSTQFINQKDGKGTPPLVAAVQNGHLDICRELLEKGVDINAVDKRLRRTAIQYSVRGKRYDIFELLIRYKPAIDIPDHHGKTVFQQACTLKDNRYFIKLLEVYPDIQQVMESSTDDGVTPVIAACKNGNPEQLKVLIEKGAAVNVVDKNNKTALHYCADNLETQCAEMLLMKDKSLMNKKEDQGFTPLHMAVIQGNAPLLKILLKKGADINCLDNEQHTVAHWATVCGHLEVLDILLENGADVSKPDIHEAFPIHYAAQMNASESGHADHRIGEKVLKKLLDNGVPCDVVDKDGRQPLLWASSAGNVECCKLLVKAGCDVNSTDKDGLSAMHCAASRGHVRCIEVLKSLGSAVDVVDKNNCTPLFYAISYGNKDCTKALLKSGANPNHCDNRGRTPTHCAAMKGCIDSIKMLDKYNAKQWESSGRGECPIHEAANGGFCDVVKYLLKSRNDNTSVNISNRNGRTCLHIAAIVNNLPLCKLLIDNGADKNARMFHKDKSYTPYDAALVKGNHETAEYIKGKGGSSAADLDNINKKRESKSAKSRKSVATLGSTQEDAKGEEEAEKGDIVLNPVTEEDDKSKKEKKDKEKEEEDDEVFKDKGVESLTVAVSVKPKGKDKHKPGDKNKGKDTKKEEAKKEKTQKDSDKKQKKDKQETESKDKTAALAAAGGVAAKKKGETKQETDKKEKSETEDKADKTDSPKKKSEEKKEEIPAAEVSVKRKGKKSQHKQDTKEEAEKTKEADKELEKKKKDKQEEEDQKEKSKPIEKEKTDLGEAYESDVKRKKNQKDKGEAEVKEEKKPEEEKKEEKVEEKPLKKEDQKKEQKAKEETKKEAKETKETKKPTEEKVEKKVPQEKQEEEKKVVLPEKESEKPKSPQKEKQVEKPKTPQKEKESEKPQTLPKEEDDKKPKTPQREKEKQVESVKADKQEEPSKEEKQEEKEPKKKEEESESEEDKKRKAVAKETKAKEKESKEVEEGKDKKEAVEAKTKEDTKTQEDSGPDKVEKNLKEAGTQADTRAETKQSGVQTNQSETKQSGVQTNQSETKQSGVQTKITETKQSSAQTKSSPTKQIGSQTDISGEQIDQQLTSKVKEDEESEEEFEVPKGSPENEAELIAIRKEKTSRPETPDSEPEEQKKRPQAKSVRSPSKVPTNGKISQGLLHEDEVDNRKTRKNRATNKLVNKTRKVRDNQIAGVYDTPYLSKPVSVHKQIKEKKRTQTRDSNTLLYNPRVQSLLEMEQQQREVNELQSNLARSRMRTRASGSVQQSVRRYQDERRMVRQLHQLKRAQIYTGPIHDVVLFSKLMDVYKNSAPHDDESTLDSQVLEDWEGYLRDNFEDKEEQLKFVSNFFEDDRTGIRSQSHKGSDHRQAEEDFEHVEIKSSDERMSDLAKKTDDTLSEVQHKATETLEEARKINESLQSDFRRECTERLQSASSCASRREQNWLRQEALEDDIRSRSESVDKERQDRHREWHRKKNEELRKKLMKVYGTSQELNYDPAFDKKKASTPRTTYPSSHQAPPTSQHPASRPKSITSSRDGSHARTFYGTDKEMTVQMTEYGMRRVKKDDINYDKNRNGNKGNKTKLSMGGNGMKVPPQSRGYSASTSDTEIIFSNIPGREKSASTWKFASPADSKSQNESPSRNVSELKKTPRSDLDASKKASEQKTIDSKDSNKEKSEVKASPERENFSREVVSAGKKTLKSQADKAERRKSPVNLSSTENPSTSDSKENAK